MARGKAGRGKARGFLWDPGAGEGAGGTEGLVPLRRSQAPKPCGLFKVSDHLNKWRVTVLPREPQGACLRGTR